MRAILVRVGVDHSYGRWNAPVHPVTNEFVYVPIPESTTGGFHPHCERPYSLVLPAIERFASQHNLDLFGDLRCPHTLLAQSMHLDPDFGQLTYGDVGDKRGSEIRFLQENDQLVFYSGLRPCEPCNHKLIYALIGVFVVDEVVAASSVSAHRFHENSHTQKIKRGATDIIVRAKPGVSGRFGRCIPIGEYRSGAYRVRHDILNAWGGLSVKDGFIQRSARPPKFLDALRFNAWLDNQGVQLLNENNPNG